MNQASRDFTRLLEGYSVLNPIIPHISSSLRDQSRTGKKSFDFLLATHGVNKI